MGFFTRYITDDSLVAFAKGELLSFNTYMINADAYNLSGEYTPCFWNFYNEERESRESLWYILRSESNDKEYLIKTVCKMWEASNNEKIDLDQIDQIMDYLDPVEKIETAEENIQVRRLIKILKERVKKNIENEQRTTPNPN